MASRVAIVVISLLKVEPIRGLILLASLMFCPAPSQAGFFDQLAKMIPSAVNTIDPNRALVSAPHLDATLPKHWQTFWFNEPVFHSRVLVAQTGPVDGPVILLVHGLGQNGLRDWLPIVPSLAVSYRVVMLDLPGFGLSESPKAKLSPRHYADMLHDLRQYLGPRPITVVGHSMGGAVTLRYAQRYPEDIDQIAVIDAAGILQRTAFVKHSAIDRIPLDDDGLTGPALRYAVGLQDFGNAIIEKLARLPDPTVWLGKSEVAWGAALSRSPNVNAALSLVEEDFSSAIFELDKPVAILWGGLDQVAPIRTGYLLSQVLPRAHFTVIDQAGHNPMASHGSVVAQWLLKSLDKAGKNTVVSSATVDQPSLEKSRDYFCDREVGTLLRGYYRRVELNSCTAVVLENAIIEELAVDNSLVQIKGTQLKRATFKESVVVMTAGSVDSPMLIDGSRLDLAGIHLKSAVPFEIKKTSRIIASVNRAGSLRYIHLDKVFENTQL